MKRFASLVLFCLCGFATGIAAAILLVAFIPQCGYDCEIIASGRGFLSVVGCTLGFLIFGYAFTRGARLTLLRAAAASTVLAIISILAASGNYVIELRDLYRRAELARPVVPDFDFMYMAITTRDVQTYTKTKGAVMKRVNVIPQWQRCVIDGASCDRKPRQAHMRCKSGVVYVNEVDWKAFSLIPRENLMGAIPMKSMDLCEPDNVPDR
jgi:hypothetical protein